MPVENDGEDVERQPQGQPPSESPDQSLSNENPPSTSTTSATAADQRKTITLEQQVKSGERWLIGIGIATLLVNTTIAIVYIFQLKAMRHANALTQSALKISTESSSESSKQFQAQLRHFDAGLGRSDVLAGHAADQAKISRRALRVTIENFKTDQRPWVGLTQFHDISVPRSNNNSNSLINAVVTPTVRNTGKTPARGVKVVYEVWEVKGDSKAAISNAEWMTELIEGSIAGKFEGVTDIINRSESRGSLRAFFHCPPCFPPGSPQRTNIGPPNKQSMGVLPPGGIIPLNVGGMVAFANAPDAQQAPYIIFGKITYRDVWDNQVRETTFCSFTPDISRNDFAICPVYNDMK